MRISGTVLSHESYGSKKLAYEVKKQTTGYYYIINFEADFNDIYGLEHLYRTTEEVLKFIVVRKDD